MFKSTLAALVTLLMLSLTAVAAPKCSPFTVAGSYVRQTAPYIDQLTLHIDGTAYWFSSASFDLILLGTFTPQIGSWTCLDNRTVVVTTIGSEYLQNSLSGDVPQPGQPLDINISVNLRFTQKLSMVDLNTLQQTRRTNTRIPLSNNPLGPGTISSGSCSPSGKPCDPAPYKRIRPHLTDIP